LHLWQQTRMQLWHQLKVKHRACIKVPNRLQALVIIKAVFELACKLVVDDIHNNYPNHSEYGSIIQDCKNLLHLYNDFIVVFIRQQANGSTYATT
jgi:hypothetical protein